MFFQEGNSLPLEQSPGGAGAPVITPSGNVMTRKIISMSKTESGGVWGGGTHLFVMFFCV